MFCQPRSLPLNTQVQTTFLPAQTKRPPRAHRRHLGLPHTSLFSTEIRVSQSEYSTKFSCMLPHPSLVPPLMVLQGFLAALWSWLTTTEWKSRRMAAKSNHSNLQVCKPPNASFHSEDPQGIEGRTCPPRWPHSTQLEMSLWDDPFLPWHITTGGILLLNRRVFV